jgi:hypothetical protein
VVVSLALSVFGIINFSIREILCLLLIVTGIGLAYIGLGDKSDAAVFLGTILFLTGILLLTNLSFNLKFEKADYISIALITTAIGFVMLYINTPVRKIYLLIFLILLISSAVLFIIKSNFGPDRFVAAILPVINVYWPAVVIFLLLVFLLRKEK